MDEQELTPDTIKLVLVLKLIDRICEDSHEMLALAITVLVKLSLNFMNDDPETCLQELVANLQQEHREAAATLEVEGMTRQ